MRYVLHFLFLSLLAPPLLAQPHTYIITASPLMTESLTGEATTLSADDISQKQNFFIQDVLRDAPAVHISNAGENGRQTRFAMRGALGGENLVLIDGIPVNDPAASGGSFDFADLMGDDIDQVQILPGSNAVSYGADAIGGVLALKTSSGRGPFKVKVKSEGGSHHTVKGQASLSGEHKNLALRTSLSGFKSGKGEFLNKIHHNRQSDDYRNGLSSTKLSYALTPEREIEIAVRESHAHLAFDSPTQAGDIILPLAAENKQKSRHHLAYLRYLSGFYHDRGESEITLSHNISHRDVRTPSMPFSSCGESLRLHSKFSLAWSEDHSSHFGAEGTHIKAQDDFSGNHQRNHQGLFIEHLYKPQHTTEIILGSRVDICSKIAPHATYRLALNQLWDKTRFRTSLGTGFKPPLLSDMFSLSPHATPNPALKPEHNHSFDIGLDHISCNDKIEFNLTFFANVINDVFLTERLPLFTFKRINGGVRKARGIEGKLRWSITPQCEFNMNATYTHARDYAAFQKRRTPHIPLWQVNHELSYSLSSSATFSLSAHKVTSQRDAVTSFSLPGYTVTDLRGAYEFACGKLYSRIENVMDKRYEQSFGYGNRGRSFYLGFEVRA